MAADNTATQITAILKQPAESMLEAEGAAANGAPLFYMTATVQFRVFN